MAYTSLTQADLDREVYLISWETAKLYFDILKNQFQLGIDQQNVTRYEAIYSVIQALTRSGIKPGADSSQALAELSKSRINFNQTEGAIKKLQEQMSYLTGLPMDSFSIDTSQTKNYLSALDILSRTTYSENLTNPLTDYYQKQQALSRQTEELVKKSYLPKVFLTATGCARGSSIDYNGDYKNLSQGLGYQRFNYMVGATFVYDLFSGVRRRDKLTESQLNTQASDFDLQQQQLYLRNVGSKADQGIQTAVKNLFEIPVQINASQDTYDQKIAQYKAGIINLIDLTNASFVLYRSQSDYVQALSDWLLANLDKAAATGNLDLFIQSVH
jgi:outer membrane protein TolC